MKDRMKASFEQIHAGEGLKKQTLAYVVEQTHISSVRKQHRYRRLVLAAACFLFMLMGGSWLYFTPTATISIDINPSIELSVNRFDRVLGIEWFNEDGHRLAENLNVRFQNCNDAVTEILETKEVSDLLADDGVMTIMVVGQNDAQSGRLLNGVEACTRGHRNAHCYRANESDIQEAQASGLSYGKYRAYLELQPLDPSITPEQIQSMSMREIRDLIETLSESKNEQPPSFNDRQESSRSDGNPGGNEYRNGNNNGGGNGQKHRSTN